MLIECRELGRDTGGINGEVRSLAVLRRALDLSAPPPVSAGRAELPSSLGGEPRPWDLRRLLLMAMAEILEYEVEEWIGYGSDEN